jgi:hypothetical protein
MFKKIEKTAACELRSVMRFLNARNMKPTDIHHQLCEVYGEHAMSDSMVRRWVRHFNEIRENVHDDPRIGTYKKHKPNSFFPLIVIEVQFRHLALQVGLLLSSLQANIFFLFQPLNKAEGSHLGSAHCVG